MQRPAGEQIGTIEDVILDKKSNSIMFAVVGFGGFLGWLKKYHPIPWSGARLRSRRRRLRRKYTKEQLQAAPSGSIDELTRDDGMQFRDRT